MPQAETLRVKGYSQTMRALARADRESRRETRSTIREAGNVVLRDWQARLSPIDATSAAGLRTRVRTRGVAVEQSRRRTTGTRPDYGALQMRRGVRALIAKAREFERAMERALDRVCDHFDRG